MSSEDDNSRTDEYWMGVRDALRMVDSFHKWSKRNPGRAKNLEDFIHDGLIAAAKRCESCLSEKLGLSFTEEDADEEEITLEDAVELGGEKDYDDEEEEVISEEFIEIDDAPEEPEPTPTFEEPISHVEPDTGVPFEVPDESTISIDSVERKEDEPMEDLSIEGPPREFSTDFDLVEPTTLIIDETSIPEAPTLVEPEPEEARDEEIETTSELESEELPDKSSFTWSEYEKAVTPSSEPEPLDSELDILMSEDEIESEEIEEDAIEEPPEPPTVWSPYDEPSIKDEDSDVETEPEIDKPGLEVEGNGESVISKPPPPPPPPESEEDEEERKRRARRLFFGA